MHENLIFFTSQRENVTKNVCVKVAQIGCFGPENPPSFLFSTLSSELRFRACTVCLHLGLPLSGIVRDSQRYYMSDNALRWHLSVLSPLHLSVIFILT